MKPDIISTWIYLDSPEESSEYPQVGKHSHLLDFQKTYWKCVAVFFALSRRFNPEKRHILFSNKRLADFPEIEGFDLQGFLKKQNVEVVTLPLTWQTPEGYFGKWRNQFYIFDVLSFIEKNSRGDEALLVLDSDCLITRPLDGLFGEIRAHGLMALPMHFADTYNINGVTRQDMKRIFGELDGAELPENPEYCGGEIFAATLPAIRQINQMAPAIWREMLRRHESGQQKLNEEAHFLSYCYHKIGSFGELDGFIKRIWTSPKFSNVQPADASLPIWHLPAEKTGGIALLFEKLKRNEQVLAVGDAEMPTELGKYLGVPRRRKWLNFKHFLKHTALYRALVKN